SCWPARRLRRRRRSRGPIPGSAGCHPVARHEPRAAGAWGPQRKEPSPMAILGLLFILGAGAVTAGAIYDGGESATIEVFGLSGDTTIGRVLIAGLATMLIFFLGVWLLFSSMGRSRRKRMERKQARTRQKES